jgi:alpha-tubulin suppressor-like RCC1 family protein
LAAVLPPRSILGWLCLTGALGCALDPRTKNACNVVEDCPEGNACVAGRCMVPASGDGGPSGATDGGALGSTDGPVAQRASYLQVAAGPYHTCVLRADHTIACWGGAWDGRLNPPEGPFNQITVGDSHGCALGANQKVTCWGNDTAQERGPPDVKLVSLANSRAHSCGLDAAGRAYCWGIEKFGMTQAPPEVAFKELTLGGDFTCGLKMDGNVQCWGKALDPPVPAGPFTTVAAGDLNACGVRPGGQIACWGDGPTPEFQLEPGNYKALAMGGTFGLAQREDGTLRMWGQLDQDRAPPTDRFTQFVVGIRHACGLTVEGGLTCWGQDDAGERGPPPPLRSLSVGGNHACGLTAQDQMYCWGKHHGGIRSGFKHLAVSDGHWCGIDGSGLIQCDREENNKLGNPPTSAFEEVAVGAYHACARNAEGRVACWGWNVEDRLQAPAETFKSIAAGDVHTCGITTDGTLRCWGSTSGVHQPPAGTFTQVAVDQGACAIRTDGSAVCWGNSEATSDPDRQPPPVRFSQLSVSKYDVCGIQADTAKVICWGKDRSSFTDAPAGPFVKVGIAPEFACGLRPGGAVVCWGRFGWPDEPRPTLWQ